MDSIEIFCSICIERFQDDRKPYNLKCGHSFCTICLQNWFIGGKNLFCPKCRDQVEFDQTKLIEKQFSVNFRILGLSNGPNKELKQELSILIENLKDIKGKLTCIDCIVENSKANVVSLGTHNSGLNSILHVSKSLEDKLTKFKPNVNLNEVTQIRKENETIIQDNIQRIETMLNDIQKLNDVKKESCSCVSLEKLKSYLSTMNGIEKNCLKYPQLLQDQYDKLIKDYAFLNKFEKNNMVGLMNLDKKANVESIVEGLQNDIKFSKFKIGVVGNSRTGKSSLINRLRNSDDPPDDKFNFEPDMTYNQAAPVGEIETTFFPVRYTMIDKPSIEFIDFPGHSKITADKKTSKIQKYFKLFLENNKCHIYFIVYTEGLDPFDLELAKIIHVELKRKVFLLRNKIDQDFENKKSRNPNKTQEEILEMLKSGVKAELNDPRMSSIFDENFKRQDLEFYIISSKISEWSKYDSKSLKQLIINGIFDDFDEGESLFFENVLSNMKAEGNRRKIPLRELFLTIAKEKIRETKVDLEKRIIYLSALSAATDIVPIGGTIADIAILVGEITKYRDDFGLKREVLDKWGEKFSIPNERIANIAKIVAIDSKYIHIKNLVFTLIGGVGVGLQIASNITSTISLGINIATFGVGCAISAAISGPISYIMCSKVLKKALTQMEADAIKIVELIYKEIVEIEQKK